MRMKTRAILILAMIWSYGLYGQEDEEISNDYIFNDIINMSRISYDNVGPRTFDLRYEGVKGTPMIFENWRDGVVYLNKEDSKPLEVEVNYNALEQQLLFKLPTGKMGVLPLDAVERVTAQQEDTTYLFKPYPQSEVEGRKKEDLKFYEVLYAGDCTFLKVVNKKFKRADYKHPYGPDRRADTFIDLIDYFLKVGDGEYEKIKLKEKHILKALSDHAPEAEAIVKEYGWELETEPEVIALLRKIEE